MRKVEADGRWWCQMEGYFTVGLLLFHQEIHGGSSELLSSNCPEERRLLQWHANNSTL